MEETLRILVVEDDFLIAEQLAFEILQLGDDVVGPFADIDSAANSLARADAAILDVRLRGGTSFALADRLVAVGMPFLFLTGYGASYLPERFGAGRLYNKPSPTSTLLANLHLQDSNVVHEPSLEDILVLMIKHARRAVSDESVAERIVESVLISAIAAVEAGEPIADMHLWLLTRLDQECALRRRIHMH